MGKTVVISCEFSGVIRRAFRNCGFNAYSCDLQSAEDYSEYHYKGDVFEFLAKFECVDLHIAHPPCTYLCNSGVQHLHKEPGRWELMKLGCEFFKRLYQHPAKRVCIENPIMHKYAANLLQCTPTQIIHPFEHGHEEQKSTCLYLRNLPKLLPTWDVYERMMTKPIKSRQRLYYYSGADRSNIRSKTYEGIAFAMVEQWGPILESSRPSLDDLNSQVIKEELKKRANY